MGTRGFKGPSKQKKMSPINMFTRDKLREVASLAENQFNNGIKKGCGGILGFALTRLQPRYLKFEKNISVPAMSEYVVVKITGRGKEKVLR